MQTDEVRIPQEMVVTKPDPNSSELMEPGKRHERLKLKDLQKNGKSWQSVQLGSPPLKKYEQFGYKVEPQKEGIEKKKLMKFEQPQSLDCEGMAPMIKITPMSDMESDSDSSMLHHIPVMDYLSPLCLQVCILSIESYMFLA